MQAEHKCSEYDEVEKKVSRAKKALEIMSNMTQEHVDKITAAMCRAGIASSARLAIMAVEETGVGNVNDKVIKNTFGCQCVYDYMKERKSVGILNRKNGVTCIAEPKGVIVVFIPVTNPGCAPIFKSMMAMKTRNAIIFAFHPRAQMTGVEAAWIMREAAHSAGAPKDCIQWIDNSSVGATAALLKNPDITMIVATDDQTMVKDTQSSGHHSYGFGSGNVPAYIEKTADLDRATKDLVLSKTFDYGCVNNAESSVIFDDNRIAMTTLDILRNRGGHICNIQERNKLESIMFNKDDKSLNGNIVGKSPQKLAALAGFSVDKDIKFLLVSIKAIGQSDWFSYEKLSPVLGWYTAENKDKAIQAAIDQLNFFGAGHNAVIHSRNENIVEEYALRVPSSMVIWNQPSIYAMTPILTGNGSRGGYSISEDMRFDNLIKVKKLVNSAQH